MTRNELQNEIDTIDIEIRSMMNDVKDSSKDVNVEEIRSKKAELETRKANLVKELAQADAPSETRAASFLDKEELLKFARGEVRSIQIGSTGGAINQIKKVMQKIQDRDDILNKVTIMYGNNASSIIPVLTPPADPTGVSEGATNVSVDTTAEISYTEIQPRGYPCVLPITAEQLVMGFVDIENELPEMFAKVFQKVMHKGLINGDGSNKNMQGIWTAAASTGANVTTLAATNASLKISNVAALAVTLAGKDNEYEIVISPTAYADLVSDSTTGEDVKIYKEGLIRDKMIEGIPVRIDSNATYTKTTGQVLAVGVPLARYAIGVAGTMTLERLKKVGDTNTYIQAEYFFGGKQTSPSDLYAIVEG